MSRFVQKSFSRGILPSSVTLRTDVQGYDQSAKDLFNMGIGRLGEAHKRAGSAIIASLDKDPVRVIPFYASDKQYLILFFGGDLTLSNSSTLVDCNSISIVDLDGFKLTKKPSGFTKRDYLQPVPLQMYGRGVEPAMSSFRDYWQPVEVGYSQAELEAMDYDQLENVLIFTGKTFAPFYIRKEDDDFIFYRCAVDMVVNGDEENSEGSFKKAIRTLPFSYYGYGLTVEDRFISRTERNIRFVGRLSIKNSFDSSGLSNYNLKFWRNRAFVVSVVNTATGDIAIYNGLIKRVVARRRSGTVSKYEVQGYLHTESNADINADDFNKLDTNLYLCDWSVRLGFPKSVTVYENRILFFANDAFPSKMWFSAQPGLQRVRVGSTEEISRATGIASEIRTIQPIYRTIYFSQIDLFNIDVQVTGLLPQQASSSGSIFINDNKGFSGLWMKAGEVLFLGTSEGIFVSSGTSTQGNNTIPFNTGFIKSIEHPVKDVYPIVVDETLFYISEDNSCQRLQYQRSRNGFITNSLDTFSRGVIKDVSTTTEIIKQTEEVSFTVDRNTLRTESNLISTKTSNTVSLDSPDKSFLVSVVTGETLSRTEWGFINLKEPTTGAAYVNRKTFQAVGVWSETAGVVGEALSEGTNPSFTNINIYMGNLFDELVDVSDDTDFSYHGLTHLAGGIITYTSSFANDISHNRIELTMVYLMRQGATLSEGAVIGDASVILKGSFPLESTSRTEVDISPQVISRQLPSLDQGSLIDSASSTYSTALIGTIDDGFIQNNKLRYSEPLTATRLVGIDRLSSNSLRLYFNKPNLNMSHLFIANVAKTTDVPTLGSVSNALVLYEGEIGTISGTIAASTEFGRVAKSVWYVDLETLHPVDENISNLKILNYLTTNNDTQILGESNCSLGDLNSLKSMRDDLLNTVSGEYNVNAVRVRLIETNTAGQAITNHESQVDTVSYYDTHFKSNLENIVIEYGRGQNLPARASTVSVTNDPNLIQVSNPTTIDLTRKVFTNNTRLVFDWANRSLYIFRKTLPYLAYTFDKETLIQAWTRGDLNFNDVLFMKTLPYNPPAITPALIGIRNNRLLMLPRSISNIEDAYIENLPNSLDEHIVFDKTSETIDFQSIKDKLLVFGYRGDERISICTRHSVIKHNIAVNDLINSIGGQRGDAIIVGKPFTFKLLAGFPKIEDRSGVLMGQAFSPSQIIFSLIHASPITLNDNSINPETETLTDIRKVGIGLQLSTVNANRGYNPIIEIKSDNPLPFSLSGYILIVNKSKE